MEKYCLKRIDTKEYFALVSLLDYRQSISEQLKTIILEQGVGKKVLVDSALISGINDYRFISLKVSEDGVLDFRTIEYVSPNSGIIEFSNKVLSNYKEYVEHSVLSSVQVEALLK
ncbi:TPA: type II toxin-antitoxin system RnlB family antitoxin [Streptococcus suis]